MRTTKRLQKYNAVTFSAGQPSHDQAMRQLDSPFMFVLHFFSLYLALILTRAQTNVKLSRRRFVNPLDGSDDQARESSNFFPSTSASAMKTGTIPHDARTSKKKLSLFDDKVMYVRE